VGHALGVPPWWIYNPVAYETEIKANHEMLKTVLSHGLELSALAEQMGFDLSDLQKVYAGFQGKFIDIAKTPGPQVPVDDVIEGTVTREHDPESPRFASAPTITRALAGLGHSHDVAGSSVEIASGQARALIVAREIGQLRSQAEQLTAAISEDAGVSEVSVAIAPYKVRTGEQLEAIATSISAEAGMAPDIEARQETDNRYLLTSGSYELLALEPWRSVIEGIFTPSLAVAIKVKE
jgi:hypothetical protein